MRAGARATTTARPAVPDEDDRSTMDDTMSDESRSAPQRAPQAPANEGEASAHGKAHRREGWRAGRLTFQE